MIEKRGKCRGDGFLLPRKLILIILHREEEGTQHISFTVTMSHVQSGAPTYSNGFVNCFLQVRSVAWGSMEAAIQPNKLCRPLSKHVTKASECAGSQTVVFSPMVVKSENSTISRKATHPRTRSATHDAASRRRHFVTTTAGGSRQQASTMLLYARRARQ